jgi:hypothetical protein
LLLGNESKEDGMKHEDNTGEKKNEIWGSLMSGRRAERRVCGVRA